MTKAIKGRPIASKTNCAAPRRSTRVRKHKSLTAEVARELLAATGDRTADVEAGEQLALTLIERIRLDGAPVQFGWIIKDLVEAARHEYSKKIIEPGRIIGFCGTLGDHVMRARPLTKIEVEQRANLHAWLRL